MYLSSAMGQILEISYSLENITDAVVEFWKALNKYKTFAFNGEMGAGKTTFIHALCGHLGVTDAVSSPTFALINEYHFTDVSSKDSIIYHMDWYRLKNTKRPSMPVWKTACFCPVFIAL